MNKLLKAKKYGSAMVLAVLAIVILAAMGLGLLSIGHNSRLSAVQGALGIQARTAADAGLAKAFYEMNEKLKVKPWSDSSLPSETDSAIQDSSETYSYIITGSSSAGYSIESTGKSGGVQKKVVSSLPLQGPFDYSLFSNSYIWLASSTTVDQYNTDATTPTLTVGTNSTASAAVSLFSGTQINGDVVVGLGSNINTAVWNKGTVTGNIYAAAEPQPTPSITVPAALAALLSSGTLTDGNVTTSAKYTKIDLNAFKTVTIKGPVSLYVTGDILLGNSAQIIIDNNTPNSSLTIYLGGNLTSQNGSGINNQTQDPQKLKLFGLDTCTSMGFKNSNAFYGAVYAPKADVIYYNSADLYGSVIAKSFQTKAAANIHYDASLRDVTVNDEAVTFTIKKWHEQ
jgi:hypothetical protein